MTERQDAWEVREFTQYIRDLVTLLDPGSGWYGLFLRRDPAGMRACLDGVEIPPWDVMESLLGDLAALRGTAFAQRESVRAAGLYSSSVAAHDRRPGGRQVLVERLELMRGEQARAARRLRAAGAGGTTPPDAEAAAWARDDHVRATARCSELRERLAAAAVPDGWFRTEVPEVPGERVVPGAQREREVPGVPEALEAPGVPEWAAEVPDRAGEAGPERVAKAGPEGVAKADPERAAEAGPERVPQAPLSASGPPAPGRRRPRGARFAGLDMDEADEAAVLPAPVLPLPPTTAAAPRGARFAAAPPGDDTSAGSATRAAAPAPEAHRAAVRAVERLVRLRAVGSSGEAHVVLCEAAGWPAEWLPALAVELHRAGLDADWATLLWEVSSLPPARLASAAGALHAAGRPDDCGQLLRQGVARPAGEIAAAVVALDRAGQGPQARALLGAFVRVRTPQDAAKVAAGDPHRLVPPLLAAARAVSPARERDVAHALRVAGIAGAP
ncbi:hypothetical protein OG887_33655 [Streptomyces sp. NBC_00053]|uniref:hypothetical protein n=1 Tax=unclassified Streptomyces TaxID=2593676 RepID=UPI00225C4063|nr:MULTISPECIES: hypothetical protein [unclassified Streptomyces]MCX5164159.1 hypothetical protein [Streptomyces sp. NBC_00305]MCX5222683.1 hypothetical protein [Streptomyces sp. NBC_00264]MCX5504285.1 hypothetical protein [Streptomyces sp. NBC_00052]MCX5547179.1 hypothetical protein [Streptomyces sp. NBC_00051]